MEDDERAKSYVALGWHTDMTAVTVAGRSSGVRPRFHRLFDAWMRQLQVIHALMLHDIKARFFGSGLGYVATILWPSVHITIIVSLFYFAGRPAPYGNDRVLYACVGALPYIIWSYVSRFTHLGALTNKTFLQYPVVKPLDLIISRVALELVSCTIIICGLAVFLAINGSELLPHRIDDAFYALASAALLGIGFGVLGAVIVMIFPLFNALYIAVVMGFWVSAGLVLNPEEMPEAVGRAFAWVPLLHSVEWLRLAYYDDYPAHLLDRTYVFGFGAATLTLGLILERLLRVFTMR